MNDITTSFVRVKERRRLNIKNNEYYITFHTLYKQITPTTCVPVLPNKTLPYICYTHKCTKLHDIQNLIIDDILTMYIINHIDVSFEILCVLNKYFGISISKDHISISFINPHPYDIEILFVDYTSTVLYETISSNILEQNLDKVLRIK